MPAGWYSNADLSGNLALHPAASLLSFQFTYRTYYANENSAKYGIVAEYPLWDAHQVVREPNHGCRDQHGSRECEDK
jgi:hypothetical protein